MKKLPLSFYRQPNVLEIAKLLIGKYLFTRMDGMLCGGIIAETEAYAGITDRASHAYNGRRTARTETMYSQGGISYVYFSYGMHHLFNVVTAGKDVPHAILIRGIIPTDGIETQKIRRKIQTGKKQLANGPAKLCQALGITLEHNGISLTGNRIWIAEGETSFPEGRIISAPRVGVDYAGQDAKLPYRFILQHPDYLPVRNKSRQTLAEIR